MCCSDWSLESRDTLRKGYHGVRALNFDGWIGLSDLEYASLRDFEGYSNHSNG